MIKRNEIFPLIGSILLCELAGLVGAIASTPAIPTWYAGLQKPALNPPSWVFGPVWTTLYALMGIAAFLVWRKRKLFPGGAKALGLFGAQLGVNALWSFLFFGAHAPGLALVDIILMWILIVLTINAFFRYSRTAGYLLLPYLAWVSFATYLNASIWWLNR